MRTSSHPTIRCMLQITLGMHYVWTGGVESKNHYIHLHNHSAINIRQQIHTTHVSRAVSRILITLSLRVMIEYHAGITSSQDTFITQNTYQDQEHQVVENEYQVKEEEDEVEQVQVSVLLV